MSIGSWTPDQTPSGIDRMFFEKVRNIALSGDIEQVAELLSSEEQRDYAHCMRLDEAAWQDTLADSNSAELRALIRFFTRAEELLPNWEAGAKSPAIWCNRALKRLGEKLDRNELEWIRHNTHNRFIPNGGL